MNTLMWIGNAMAAEPASAVGVLLMLFVAAYGFVLWATSRTKRRGTAA